jgi:hypothetical protein
VIVPLEFVENWTELNANVSGYPVVLPVKTPSEKLANVGVVDIRFKLAANGADNVRVRLT